MSIGACMKHFALVAAASVALAWSATASAAHQRRTVTDAYRVQYAGTRDVYCLRAFADPAPADPTPRNAGDPCRARATWARDGIQIHDPQRDPVATVRR